MYWNQSAVMAPWKNVIRSSTVTVTHRAMVQPAARDMAHSL